MRAAVMTEPGRMIVVDDWPEPELRADDVLVRMEAVGICGTDLGYWKGTRVAPEYPWLLGHEGVGRIIAIGDAVQGRTIGERVAIEPNYPCGECEPCLAGVTGLCTNRGSVALNEPGLLAERVRVPAHYAWPLPEDLPIEAAVCVEPLAVVQSAIRKAKLDGVTGPVLVVGAGAQGLLAIETLVGRGHEVAVTEPQEARRALALELGAREARTDEQFPRSIESSGSAPGGRVAIESLAPNGRCVFIGVGADPVQLDSRVLVRRGITVAGSMIYDHPVDFGATVESVVTRTARPDRTLGTRFEFDESEAAFAGAASLTGKTWIRIDPDAR